MFLFLFVLPIFSFYIPYLLPSLPKHDFFDFQCIMKLSKLILFRNSVLPKALDLPAESITAACDPYDRCLAIS